MPISDPDRLLWPNVPHPPNIILFGFGMGVAIFLVIGALVHWTSPSISDRFDTCMTLAEQSRLLESRREDTALICLSHAKGRCKSETIGIIPPYPVGGTASRQ